MLYTKGEEIFNSVTHGIGALLSVVGLTVMIIFAALFGNVWQVVSVSIYGATLVILYTMSTLYHALTNEKAKKIFQIFDHSSIYLLIAGTYTPYTLVLLRQHSIKGWVIFGIIWGVASIGITLTSIFLKKIKKVELVLYLTMGFIILVAFPDMISILNANGNIGGLYWLIIGGLFYTIGCAFYKIKKIKYFHSIWHIFVLLGSIAHFISIMFYIL